MIVVGCRNPSEKEKLTIQENANLPITDCNTKSDFGNITLCLPHIEGQTECHTHPKVQRHLAKFEDPENVLLGYYLSDRTFERVDSLGHFSFDNYYKVYASKKVLGVEADRKMLKDVMALMTSGFLDMTAEELNKDKNFSKHQINISEPVLLEKYTLSGDASIMVALMRLSGEQSNHLMAFTMGSVLIKKRLIFVAHYMDYTDESSIQTLKRNTEEFIKALNAANS
ncbi:hypothetical protein ALE3EI_1542 [Constantimarinum furrinae]|uniref:Uncharacterized protein n=2 Tax=Constantimarinum furrinae TaxID=2562285 RepID=A0A7G8PUT4_9FLAO|nr:hypothetical protein ALE3EI_1542 [Constantimarinum furrinae]